MGGLAETLGLEGAQPPPEGEATVKPAPETSALNAFGKMAANETSFGGSPGATARGTWLASAFGPNEEIPREYTRSGSTDERAAIEQNVRDDLAEEAAAHPGAALGAKGIGLVNHAMLASGVPMAGFAQSIGAGGLMGAAEGAVRAHNANEDVVQGATQGGLQGAVVGGVLQQGGQLLAPVARMFARGRDAARGVQIAGAKGAQNAEAANVARQGVEPTLEGVGTAARELELPRGSTHSYEHSTQAVRDAAKARADAAVAAASVPPEAAATIPPAALRDAAMHPEVRQGSASSPSSVLDPEIRRQGTMLPPPNAASEALGASTQALPAKMPVEIRRGVRSSGEKTIDMGPGAAERVQHLPDAEYPAAPQGATGRPPGRLSKKEILENLRARRAATAGRIDPDAAAAERALGAQEKRLAPLPEQITPEQGLEIRRGLDKASEFRPGETVIPGRKLAARGTGRDVREQLSTAMNETPHGPAFAESQATGAKAAAIQALAKKHAATAVHKSLGTGAAGALLGGGYEALHGMHAPTAGTLASAFGTGVAAAGARHYGPEIASAVASGAEKAMTHPALRPGETASSLDIWAVKEKRKNETDPEYRKQQRRKAAESE